MRREPVILFRINSDTKEEFEVAKKYLPVVRYRSEVPEGSLVIGRYSVLPFYEELEEELALYGSRLINRYGEHCYVAEMFWARNLLPWKKEIELEGLTPKTWDEWGDLPENMSFVVKGKTNSRKFSWNTHMFAQSREDVPRIATRLLDDYLIREQGLVVREYVPLKKLGEGMNGLPITNEWRTFWLGLNPSSPVLLARGFYWASHPELQPEDKWDWGDFQWVFEAAKKIAPYVPFFVLDIAETEKGDWIVVEVNDGQMSGLSMCDPEELYANLAGELKK